MSNPFAPPGPQPQPLQDPFTQPAQGHFTAPGQAPFAQPGPGQFAQPVPQAMYGGSGPMWAPQPLALPFVRRDRRTCLPVARHQSSTELLDA